MRMVNVRHVDIHAGTDKTYSVPVFYNTVYCPVCKQKFILEDEK
jgi:hypothetical protein